MWLLVDCSPLSAGGGVQVAIALIDGLSRRSDIDWLAVLPESMQSLGLPHRVWQKVSRLIFLPKNGLTDLVQARFKLMAIERMFTPDVVFSVFGPAYFRARAPHLVGFALPNLIYKRTRALAESNYVLTSVADWLRCRLCRQADVLVVETQTVANRLTSRIGCDPGLIPSLVTVSTRC